MKKSKSEWVICPVSIRPDVLKADGRANNLKNNNSLDVLLLLVLKPRCWSSALRRWMALPKAFSIQSSHLRLLLIYYFMLFVIILKRKKASSKGEWWSTFLCSYLKREEIETPPVSQRKLNILSHLLLRHLRKKIKDVRVKRNWTWSSDIYVHYRHIYFFKCFTRVWKYAE